MTDEEDPLLTDLIGALRPALFRVGPDREGLPIDKGAYVLLLTLDRPVVMPRRAQPWLFEAGVYAYAGSAYGAGGLKARIARHLRRDKRIHWHIDHLTGAAAKITVLAGPGQSECMLVTHLLASGAFDIPCSGFGSSDCRHCSSHLLRLTASSPDAVMIGP